MSDRALSSLDTSEIMRLEREIAAKHLGHTPWFAIAWGLGNFAIWLSLWPLVLTGILPLWAGFLIACANITLSYLPSHEAQHDIIAKPGEPLRWLNQLVGHVSTLPLVLPYRVAKLTHMEHHKHANNPDLDPDYSVHAPSGWAMIRRSILSRQPRTKGGLKSYGDTLQRLGREDVILDAVLYDIAFYGVLFALAWSGYAIEAALLWWLPRHIGLTYIQFFLSWAPHHPGHASGRYKDTRSFRSVLGNIGSLGMQFHIVHHLHPRIPLYRTPAAYWEMKPVLEARGCDVHDL
ncbi:MAG: fatty acid desaturase [Pseudomonadota bacterium]